MRRSLPSAVLLASSLLALGGVARAADAPFDAYSQYPRLPASTVAAEHFDYPSRDEMFYRNVYGDIGGYGYPESITSDREFTSSTPVYMLRHRRASAGGRTYVMLRRGRHMSDRGGYVVERVASLPLHYVVPDYVATTSYSQDGESYRKVTPGRYVNAFEGPGAKHAQ